MIRFFRILHNFINVVIYEHAAERKSVLILLVEETLVKEVGELAVELASPVVVTKHGVSIAHVDVHLRRDRLVMQGVV